MPRSNMALGCTSTLALTLALALGARAASVRVPAPSAKAPANTALPDNVYFFESSKNAAPGPRGANRMFRFSPANESTIEMQVPGITPWQPGYEQAYTSGATLCGSTYYAVWTDIEQGQDGIAQVVINGNAGEYSQTTLSKGGAPMATDVYHQIWCDPQDATKLFAVRSSPQAGSETRAHFSLRHVDTKTGNDTKLFDYEDHGTWSASDTNFEYDPEKGQFWATWAIDGRNGHPFERSSYIDMVSLNTEDYTASPVQTWTLGDKGGWIYALFANLGDGQLHATLHHRGDNPSDVQGLVWADLTLGSDGSVKVKEGASAQEYLFSAGAPIPTCGGLLWTHSQIGNTSHSFIYGINPATPDKVEITVDLTQYVSGWWPGAIAC